MFNELVKRGQLTYAELCLSYQWHSQAERLQREVRSSGDKIYVSPSARRGILRQALSTAQTKKDLLNSLGKIDEALDAELNRLTTAQDLTSPAGLLEASRWFEDKAAVFDAKVNKHHQCGTELTDRIEQLSLGNLNFQKLFILGINKQRLSRTEYLIDRAEWLEGAASTSADALRYESTVSLRPEKS